MKQFLLSLLISCPAICFGALNTGGDADQDTPASDEITHYPALILVQDADVDETIDDLESQGVIVLRHRSNILLAYIPAEKTSRVSAPGKFRSVRKIEFSKPRLNEPTMNLARSFHNADLIGLGKGLPQAYDGTGVVVGICDIGFDSRHPNFLDVDQKECRIRKVVQYREYQGERKVYETPEAIYKWQTDTDDDWHATHVMGIAAGAHTASGFQGMAPGADIVFTGSVLSDVGILAGVEDIIEYAREVGKPAVVNLSVGNYVGPHDGSSLFAQYLDLCADDAIICISAGNEGRGNKPRSLSYDFTEGHTELRYLPNDWGGTDLTGETEVWSADSRPFKFTFYFHHDTSTSLNDMAYEEILFDDTTTRWRVSADPADPDYDEAFARHYDSGYAIATGGVSPLNGRYYVNLQFEGTTQELRPGQAWALYWPGVKVEASEGMHVDVYCAGGSFIRQERTFPAPDNAQCVSDLATGFKTICVGMTNNTDVDSSQPVGSGWRQGDVCIHSGYGTLADGRVLPHTCAPGAYIISSISSAFIDKYPENIPYTSFSAEYDGRTVYWVDEIGTSMSTPYVAGTIATWLQANPNLTSDEAKRIILTTNQTSGYPSVDDPRHGQGWFEPYNGLQKVLDLAALNVTSVADANASLRIIDGIVYVGNPSGQLVTIDIYNPAGVLVERLSVSGQQPQANLSHLAPGIYILKASTPYAPIATRKIRL